MQYPAYPELFLLTVLQYIVISFIEERWNSTLCACAHVEELFVSLCPVWGLATITVFLNDYNNQLHYCSHLGLGFDNLIKELNFVS